MKYRLFQRVSLFNIDINGKAFYFYLFLYFLETGPKCSGELTRWLKWRVELTEMMILIINKMLESVPIKEYNILVNG